jgi:hypothetical protein
MSRPTTGVEKAAIVAETISITHLIGKSALLGALTKRPTRRQQEKELTFGTAYLSTWMDQDIVAGVDWGTQIKQAIERSAAFVVLVPNAPSPSVGIECGLAMSAKINIIPIARTPSDLKGYQLNRYQALPWPENTADWIAKFRTALIHATT